MEFDARKECAKQNLESAKMTFRNALTAIVCRRCCSDWDFETFANKPQAYYKKMNYH